MTVSLGTAWWKLVAVIDGFALITHRIQHRSRWVDLRTWPAKVGLSRDEWTRSVARSRAGRIASLVGWTAQTVWVQEAQGKERVELKVPFKKFGYRAVGFVGERVVLVPGDLTQDRQASPLVPGQAPLVHDGKKFVPLVGGEPGNAPTLSAIVPLADGSERLVWQGRVCRVDGETLLPLLDLPRTNAAFETELVPLDDDSFACAAGGRIAIVTSHVTLKSIDREQTATVRRFEDRLLATTVAPYRHWRFDPVTDAYEPLDFGMELPHPDTVFAAPCGLVALADDNKSLVRLRP